MNDTILGFDPGSRNTGYAVLNKSGNGYVTRDCGVISLAHLDDHSERLQLLYSSVKELVITHRPASCAVETPVYGKDPLAMLKLGRAQAAIMLAIINQDIPVSEYYPKSVKKSITGRGNAGKEQVAYMLRKMITLPEKAISADATDALAVAWCHHLQLASPVRLMGSPTKTHQNRISSSWSEFVKDNEDRIKKG
ncbi:MAG: crossover junction endodeoxyribonuclease RuvC [Balneolales bacterium]